MLTRELLQANTALAGLSEEQLSAIETLSKNDENTAIVLSALREAADSGKAVLLVTHEKEAFDCADHLFQMNAGTLRSV